MSFKMINTSFLCEKCWKKVSKHPSWSARNHCPFCLYSKHLDKDFPWDRASSCWSLMQAIWKDYHKNKWWMIVHQCCECWKKIPNMLARDDAIEIFAELWM